MDNRYIMANLISCNKEEPRIVDEGIWSDIFDIQEKVIEDILSSFQKQQALQAAPRTVDPIQQTLATTLQGYINHPDVDRDEAITAIKFLNEPMLNVQIRKLREINKRFQADGDAIWLLAAIKDLQRDLGKSSEKILSRFSSDPIELSRNDLRLICFDIISGG